MITHQGVGQSQAVNLYVNYISIESNSSLHFAFKHYNIITYNPLNQSIINFLNREHHQDLHVQSPSTCEILFILFCILCKYITTTRYIYVEIPIQVGHNAIIQKEVILYIIGSNYKR